MNNTAAIQPNSANWDALDQIVTQRKTAMTKPDANVEKVLHLVINKKENRLECQEVNLKDRKTVPASQTHAHYQEIANFMAKNKIVHPEFMRTIIKRNLTPSQLEALNTLVQQHKKLIHELDHDNYKKCGEILSKFTPEQKLALRNELKQLLDKELVAQVNNPTALILLQYLKLLTLEKGITSKDYEKFFNLVKQGSNEQQAEIISAMKQIPSSFFQNYIYTHGITANNISSLEVCLRCYPTQIMKAAIAPLFVHMRPEELQKLAIQAAKNNNQEILDLIMDSVITHPKSFPEFLERVAKSLHDDPQSQKNLFEVVFSGSNDKELKAMARYAAKEGLTELLDYTLRNYNNRLQLKFTDFQGNISDAVKNKTCEIIFKQQLRDSFQQLPPSFESLKKRLNIHNVISDWIKELPAYAESFKKFEKIDFDIMASLEAAEANFEELPTKADFEKLLLAKQKQILLDSYGTLLSRSYPKEKQWGEESPTYSPLILQKYDDFEEWMKGQQSFEEIKVEFGKKLSELEEYLKGSSSPQ